MSTQAMTSTKDQQAFSTNDENSQYPLGQMLPTLVMVLAIILGWIG